MKRKEFQIPGPTQLLREESTSKLPFIRQMFFEPTEKSIAAVGTHGGGHRDNGKVCQGRKTSQGGD